jgi:signal transduction histidine kinase
MSLRTGLLLALAYVLVLTIVALELPLATSVRDRIDAEVRSQATSQAQVLAASAGEAAQSRDRRALGTLAAAGARNTRGRVVVVDAAGTVLADSGGTGTMGASYATPDRPEIVAAIRGRADQRVRRSATLNTDLLATAVPIVGPDRSRVGAVRVTQDIAGRNRAVRSAWRGLILVGLLVLGLAMLVGAVLAGRVIGPVRRLQRAAARVGAGDLKTRAQVEGSTEQRALAREFNTMTQRLERLLRSQQEFVADASHQLRTPLAGLRLRIEEAQAETTEPAVREELDHALAEVDRLAQMVAELLELSRAGERELPGESVDLREAAGRAAARWSATAADRGQRVDLTTADGAALAWCAPADLDRALDALVENALHYSPVGTTVTLAANGDAIEVVDEGPGLGAGEEDAVFERFHRGGAGRAGPGGTGLGLAIARELVQRWGGEVTLTNRPAGDGAVARVAVPPPRA